MSYLEMPADDRKNYDEIVKTLKKEFRPDGASFVAMREFEKKKLLPGESPAMFLHNLRKLLDVAMPELGEGKEQMLLHHFIEGLPKEVARLMRTSSEIENTKKALNKARLLILTIDQSFAESNASLSSSDHSRRDDRIEKLEGLISQLCTKLDAIEKEKMASVQKQPREQSTGPLSATGANGMVTLLEIVALLCVLIAISLGMGVPSVGEMPAGRLFRSMEAAGTNSIGPHY